MKKESEVKDEQEKKSAEEGNQSQSSEEKDIYKMELVRSESTDDDKIGLSDELPPDEVARSHAPLSENQTKYYVVKVPNYHATSL